MGGIKLKKIIVRNKSVFSLSAKFIFFNNDRKFNSSEEFISLYGMDKILTEVFCEDENFDLLNKKYNECIVNREDNDYFSIVTLIDDEYGIRISKNSSHIYLMHLEPRININNIPILGWYYYNNKKYVGDAWWSTDDEIVKDISNMSMVSFFKKYKGF